jgi:hypothetical protein
MLIEQFVAVLKYTHQPCRRDRGIDLDVQTFAIEVVEDVEGAKPPFVEQRVTQFLATLTSAQVPANLAQRSRDASGRSWPIAAIGSGAFNVR